MAVTVYIPTPFRRATNNKDRLQSAATTVGGLLDELEGAYTGLRGLVRGEGGQLHHHVNVYVNNEAIEALQGLATPLKDGDEVAIIPALAGGGWWSRRSGGAPSAAISCRSISRRPGVRRRRRRATRSGSGTARPP